MPDKSELLAALAVDLTGVLFPHTGNSAPGGFVLADGSLLSRTTYPNLWAFAQASGNIAASDGIWVPGQYSPGDGSTTFRVPQMNGRVPVGAGSAGTIAEVFAAAAVTIATDLITVGSNNTKWVTGMPVVLTTSGSAPGGLTAGSTYYVIRASATTIKLASSLANAQNGTGIDITSQGSGNHTITATLTARTLGESGGEEAHAMSITELLSHNHTLGFTSGATFGAGGGGGSTNTGNTGGNAAMNIMQPFNAVTWVIKA